MSVRLFISKLRCRATVTINMAFHDCLTHETDAFMTKLHPAEVHSLGGFYHKIRF